jgi:hypothetical protein
VTARAKRSTGRIPQTKPIRIAFLAITQAHQFPHWLPSALRLAREPGVEVTVLGSSPAGLDFVRSYDADGLLKLKPLSAPSLSPDGLFTPPKRRLTLLLNQHIIRRYPIVVTTETTSSILKQMPGFRSRVVLIKHGAGDREGSYNPKHALFDLILVNGDKHRQELLNRRLAPPDHIVVTGNAKVEMVRPPAPIFADGRPLALYNPHFDPDLSTWFRHGRAIVDEMERIEDLNFVIAPHVKLKDGPDIHSDAPNVLIDRGSVRSIDMTYTQAASVYMGDVSSQVYEFICTPRPCIFLNLDRLAWCDDPAFAHWHLGQVIEDIAELPAALARAADLQPGFVDAQEAAMHDSIDQFPIPASTRQADIILDFARTPR